MPFDDFVQFEYADAVDLHIGDCEAILRTLPADSFQSCITSPPFYNLRDYQVDGQIGMEPTPDAYVAKLVEVFREVRRVLLDSGTIWLNLGDCYANDTKWGGASGGKHAKSLHGNTGIGRSKRFTGAKPKDLLGIPWRVAFALQADGWWLRSAIVWYKGNVMPESVKTRPSSAYEMIFLLAKSEQYFYDAEAIREPATNGASGNRQKSWGNNQTITRSDGSGMIETVRGIPWKGSTTRNARNVWTINTKPFKDAHFATMAPEVARRCILAGCPYGGGVLDPFGGAGTTGLVAAELGRRASLIELNPVYVEIARKRLGHYARKPDDP